MAKTLFPSRYTSSHELSSTQLLNLGLVYLYEVCNVLISISIEQEQNHLATRRLVFVPDSHIALFMLLIVRHLIYC